MFNLSSPLILASGSPRRREILSNAGFTFEVCTKNVEEAYPLDIHLTKVPEFLAKLKAESFREESKAKIILASDTVVILGNQILGKPTSPENAFEMLRLMSGKIHDVYTGVCVLYKGQEICFTDLTKVWFKAFTDEEILYYIERFKPFDKAGAYGVQEWLGMVGIEKIEGSFYNVMGLPIHLVYNQLLKFKV